MSKHAGWSFLVLGSSCKSRGLKSIFGWKRGVMLYVYISILCMWSMTNPRVYMRIYAYVYKRKAAETGLSDI